MNKLNNIIKVFLMLLLTLIVMLPNVVLAYDNIKEFDVDGVKVIINKTSKDVISVRLFITGGTANYPLEKQGIEALVYNIAIRGGTTKLSKSDFLAEADKMGTEFGSSASLDFGEMNMTCLNESFTPSWELFADAILNPAFASDEFNNKKQQFITSAKRRESDPDDKLDELTFKTTFKGRNYEKIPNGTAESLNALTLDDVKSYYKENVCKKKAFLVVAGNVDENDIIEKVKSSLSRLPDGTDAIIEQPENINQPAQDIVDRKISTNYISGVMSGIPWSSPDIIPMMVAMNIMYNKYFVELRTKRGLSYAPAAYIYGDAISNPLSMFYITTDNPKDALKVMVDIINDVRKNGFTEDELKGSKNRYLTLNFMRLETAQAQTLNIGRWYLRGNLNAFEQFDKLVNAVSLQQINQVFTRSTGAIKWNYLGDPEKVSPEDFKQIEKIGF